MNWTKAEQRAWMYAVREAYNSDEFYRDEFLGDWLDAIYDRHLIAADFA